MKKFMTIIVVVMLAVVSMTMLVGCKEPVVEGVVYGAEMPSIQPNTQINANMSSTEMLMAAIDNYYNAEYVAKISEGKVDTVVVGLPVTQWVSAVLAREGKKSDTAKYWVDNRSASTFVKVWDETYIDGVNDINYRAAAGNTIDVKVSTGEFFGLKEGKDWDSKKTFENDMAGYVNASKNYPTQIWAYTTDENTINSITDVKKVKDVYSFSVDYKVDLAVEGECAIDKYIDLIWHMLRQSLGNGVKEVNFNSLKMDVEIWENGFIKSVKIFESYDLVIKAVGLTINGAVELNNINQFTYDSSEVTERIAQIKQLEA